MIGLVVTTRMSSLSSKAHTVYMLHRADCRYASTGKPLDGYADPERILMRVRDNLNGRACSYCRPDAAGALIVLRASRP